MSDFTTRTLVWLTYRLGATIALGIPLVLLIWSGLRRDPALVRLLGIYWKVASLLAISVLLLTDQRPIGYLTAFLAPLLMAASLWFWMGSHAVRPVRCSDVGFGTGLHPSGWN